MATGDIEVIRLVNGDELLRAWHECRFQIPYEELWPPAIETGSNIALIARSRKIGRKAIGCVTIKWDDPVKSQPSFQRVMKQLHPEEFTPIVYGLHVQKTHRRKGVGSKLMETAEKTILQDRAAPDRVALSVGTENEEAMLLYDRLDYNLLKMITVDSPESDGEGGFRHNISKSWIMTKDLSKPDKPGVE